MGNPESDLSHQNMNVETQRANNNHILHPSPRRTLKEELSGLLSTKYTHPFLDNRELSEEDRVLLDTIKNPEIPEVLREKRAQLNDAISNKKPFPPLSQPDEY